MPRGRPQPLYRHRRRSRKKPRQRLPRWKDRRQGTSRRRCWRPTGHLRSSDKCGRRSWQCWTWLPPEFISQRRSRRCKLARGFAPAVNEKEKRGQPNKGQSTAEHPHFVGEKRSDLLRGEKRERDSQDGGQEAAQTRGD